MADTKKKKLVLVVEGTAALAPHWPTILEDYLSKLIRACLFAPLFPSLSELIMGILAFRIIGSDQITQINGEFSKVHSTEAATPYVELALVVFNAPGSYSRAYVVKEGLLFDPRSYAWYYTYAYIEDGVNGYLLKRCIVSCKSKSHNVLRIAPVAIIDSQLPFEYTITSRSTDVMVMAYHVQNINHSAFRSMFKREKLSGNNFNDWFRQLKLVLRVEKKMYVIEQPIPPAPAADSSTNEGKPVDQYVLKMKGYVEQLERLGYVLPRDLGVGLILNGLTSDFAGFVKNYNMHNMGKTIGELHALLIEYEKGLSKKAVTPQVMAIQSGRIQKTNKKSQNAKGKGKGKGKGKDKSYVPKPKNPKPNAKEHPTKNDACHHCKEVGHWKRNCPVYLAELMKNKKQVGSANSLGIFKIELFSFPNKSWVYDTRCGTHICITKQGLRGARKLKQCDLYLYMGNGVRAQVEAIGSYDLVLPNGLMICLDNYHYEPSITRSVVSVSRLVENGFQLTPPYTPQHNRVSEKRNRTLLEMVRSMINLTTLPLSFWDYALESAARILNMVLTKKVDKTPYELWFGKVPNLSYLKVWGCEALVKRDTPDKLQQRSVKCIFIGYPKETMGYYFYFPPENKIVVARYAEFFEKNLLSQEVSGRAGELEEIQDEDTSPSEITSEIPMEVEGFEPPQEEEAPVRRSERPHRAPNRLCLNVEVEEHSLGDLNEPANYKAAMLDQESNKWLDAMNAEMQSMKDNQVWRLVDLPPNGKTVGSKWLFNKKSDMDGNVHTYKARLVAKGFTQTYGVDYEETFSPVADIRAIRILIAITTFYDYEIWQMDVKTAFLNGYLDEDIYMVQPEGFIDPKHPRKASGRNVTFLILYVDDIIIMGNHIPSLQSVKAYLGKCFAMKDLGEATFILGIKIYRDRSRRLIGLCQSAYMDKILKRYRMDNSKRGYIPMQERLDLNKTQGASTPREVKRMQNVPYASAVGSIMYAVRCTRPDVAFAQNITSHMFLVYGGNPEAELRVDCYCDAGFETDRDDTKSQTGYVFILNGGAVDWKSSKQSITAMSAT
ncbi:retrotransposon protein, putative, ty1-copia subclass [Tanacetum coccineum]|uniref:Retrotransposon protein, putative, ty1-copia subclass n=1 Tax=Tanacetum coccineum TaxID=301880 RepID=A0ABQ4ZS32_9ASTR